MVSVILLIHLYKLRYLAAIDSKIVPITNQILLFHFSLLKHFPAFGLTLQENVWDHWFFTTISKTLNLVWYFKNLFKLRKFLSRWVKTFKSSSLTFSTPKSYKFETAKSVFTIRSAQILNRFYSCRPWSISSTCIVNKFLLAASSFNTKPYTNRLIV